MARTQRCAFYMGVLGDTHLLRRAESAGMGYQELAAYALRREPRSGYGGGWSDVYHHHRGFVVRGRAARRRNVRQVGAAQYTRTHLYQRYRLGHDDTGAHSARLRP